MLQHNIVISGKTVVSSGSFICRLSDEVVLHPFGTEYKITIKFVAVGDDTPFSNLVTDADQKGVTLKIRDDDTNFIGSKNPLYVANRNNQKVMMWFTVESFGKGEERKKLFNFTLFEDGAAK